MNRIIGQNTYRQIRGFYRTDKKLITVVSDPYNPDVLSHEIMHFLEQNWVDSALLR